MSTQFVYQPSVFSLSNTAFVRKTVRDFYRFLDSGACAVEDIESTERLRRQNALLVIPRQRRNVTKGPMPTLQRDQIRLMTNSHKSQSEKPATGRGRETTAEKSYNNEVPGPHH